MAGIQTPNVLLRRSRWNVPPPPLGVLPAAASTTASTTTVIVDRDRVRRRLFPNVPDGQEEVTVLPDPNVNRFWQPHIDKYHKFLAEKEKEPLPPPFVVNSRNEVMSAYERYVQWNPEHCFFNQTNDQQDKKWQSFGLEVTGVTGAGKTSLTERLMTLNGAFQKIKPGRVGKWFFKDEPGALSVAMQLQLLLTEHDEPGKILERGPTNNLLWRIILTVLGRAMDYQHHPGASLDQYEKQVRNKIVEWSIEAMSCISPLLWKRLREHPRIVLVPRDEKVVQQRMVTRDHGSDVCRANFPMYVYIQQIVYGIYGMCTHALVVDSTHADWKGQLLPDWYIHLIHEIKPVNESEAVPISSIETGIILPVPKEVEHGKRSSLISSLSFYKSKKSCRAMRADSKPY